MMDLNTTRALIAAFGADPAHWPDPDAARRALQTHRTALTQDLAQAKVLDSQIKSVLQAKTPAPSELLERRIMKNLPQNLPVQNLSAQNGQPRSTNSKTQWRAVAALFAVVFGVIGVGFTALSLHDPSAEAAVWREAALDMGVDDIYDWVMKDDG